jgi:hypothetical protein
MMAHIDQKLEKLCRENPQQLHQVVITLTEEAQHLKAADLGLAGAEEIGDLGILKGTFTGKRLLELSKRREIAEIAPDFEAHALA